MSRSTFTVSFTRELSPQLPMEEERGAANGASSPDTRFVRFEPFRFDRVGGVLAKDGREVSLPPRAARLLACLLDEPGKVVPKDVLIAAVWDGIAVSDQSLAEAISQLRHALGDDTSAPTYVQTVHRRGYRFLAPVAVEQDRVLVVDGIEQAGGSVAGAQDRDTWLSPGLSGQGVRALVTIATISVITVGATFLVWEWRAERFEVELEAQQQQLATLEEQMQAQGEQTRAQLLDLRQAVGSAFGSTPDIDIVWQQASVGAFGASPSPDGDLIAYGLDGTAPALFRISTQETIALAQEEDPPVGWQAMNPVFSPDGQWIAYLCRDVMAEQEPELRVVGIEGGDPITLGDPTTLHRGEVLFPHAWTSDGNRLVAVRVNDSDIEIVEVSVDSGVTSTLETLDGRYADRPLKISLSPDERAIAYDFEQPDNSGRRDIYLLSFVNGAASVLVQHSADDLLPMWTPDSSSVLFISNRSGNYAAWVVNLADGQVHGGAELLWPGASTMIWPFGLTQDSSLYYGVGSPLSGSDIHVVEVDPGTSRAIGAPAKLARSFPGLNLGPTWSPDGNRLAYLSQRGLLLQPDTVVAVNLLTGNQDRLVHQFIPGLRYIRNLRWSPDGRSILVRGYDANLFWGLYLIDITTGETEPILQADVPGESTIGSGRWLPDGRSLVYGRTFREPLEDPATGETTLIDVQTLMLFDIDSGAGRELHRVVQPLARESWTLSPDGRYIAVSTSSPEAEDSWLVDLHVFPLSGGPMEKVLSVLAPHTIDHLAWAPGGERILFVRAAGRLWVEREILAVSVETGEVEPLGISLPGIREIAFDPTGARIAFVASTQEPSTDVYVLRNFLSGSRTAEDRHWPNDGRPPRR